MRHNIESESKIYLLAKWKHCWRKRRLKKALRISLSMSIKNNDFWTSNTFSNKTIHSSKVSDSQNLDLQPSQLTHKCHIVMNPDLKKLVVLQMNLID